MRSHQVMVSLLTAVALGSGMASAQLTAPNAGNPIEIGIGYLTARAPELGLDAADLVGLRVTDAYSSRHTGVTHVYLRQTWLGLDVHGANGAFHVLPNGALTTLHQRDLVRGLSRSTAQIDPALTPADALFAAADALALRSPVDVRVLQPAFGVARRTVLNPAGVSRSEIPAELVWVPNDKGLLTLAWQLTIEDANSDNWWNVRIDAATGESLGADNWTAHADYRVYAIPVESPNHSTPPAPADGRTLETDPHDPTASPFGWHDTNGAAGPEFTTTQGNNVHAYTDTDANNSPDAGSSPDGGAGLSFDYPFDQTMAPSAYRPAAVTNLFYWNNVIHDVTYGYGFNEAAGNFQTNNYGNGGLGNDSVQAEAQDGSGTNNANFGTPADGSRPRMQMYVWTAPTPDKDGDFDAGIVAHEYYHGVSNRLTGGPSNVSCLQNSEQMGEGWSDYGTLMLTTVVNDGSVPHGVGTYALNQATNGPGIRAFPYSTNLAVDPRTYQDSRTAAVPHGVGSIWTAIIWEAYWALVDAHGFNPDVYGDWTTGGNNLANQLVFDGMKLQPCSPGMVDGRNGILQADMNLTGGANQCLLWEAFAKRGLGFSATQGSSSSNGDNTNGFDMPPACLFLATTEEDAQICAGTPLSLDFNVGPAFDPNVSFAAAAVPTMTGATFGFATNPVVSVPMGNTLNIGNTGSVAAGDYTVTVTATDSDTPQNVETLDFAVSVVAVAPGAPSTLTAPANGATGVGTQPTFTWTAVAGASTYTLEVDDEPTFALPLVHSAEVSGTSYAYPATLGPVTTYYWRVRAGNACGAAANSATFDFETVNQICSSPGVAIPDNNTTGVTTTMVISDTSVITDLDVLLDITHTYIGDLAIEITSPSGPTVRIVDRPTSCSTDDIPGSYADDEGSPAFETGCNGSNPAFNPGQHYSPNNALSAFDGQALNGTWSLRVIDLANIDVGTIDQWCLVPATALSNDIFNDGFEAGNMSAWSSAVP